MAQVELDGAAIKTPQDFYEHFFRETRGLLPDHGGRNLDALNDDLRELPEPLTLIWTDSQASKASLGDWFDDCIEVLQDREEGDLPITVLLQ